MPGSPARASVQIPLDALRTELADLAFELERQGRRDAADVVMMLDTRMREMAEVIAAEAPDDESNGLVCCRSAFMPDNQGSDVGVKPRPTNDTSYPGNPKPTRGGFSP